MFSINYRDSRPIYEQVKDSLRRSIIMGVLPADAKIPSVREAATELTINPNTIQRAYRELEAEGYIYSVPGKGSFVGECNDAKEERKKELFDKLGATVKELFHLEVSAEDICYYVRDNYPKEDKS